MINFEDLLRSQQNIFASTDFSDLVRQRAERMRTMQDQMLDEMQGYFDAWCARRHEGNRSAFDTVIQLTDTNDRDGANEALRAYFDGMWGRLIDDARDQLNCFTQLMGYGTGNQLREVAPQRPKSEGPRAANTDETQRPSSKKVA